MKQTTLVVARLFSLAFRAQALDVRIEAGSGLSLRRLRRQGMGTRAATAAIAIALAATEAVAQAGPADDGYGSSILVADAATLGVFGLAVLTSSNKPQGTDSRSVGLGSLAALGYVFGGPGVHWWHGRQSRGFGSLGLRLGSPLAGALLGAPIGAALYHETPGCGCQLIGAIDGALIGGGVGVLVAMITDAAWLGHDSPPASDAPRAAVMFTGKTLALYTRF